MPEEDAAGAGKTPPKKMLTQVLFGAIIVIAVACAFFVFYVSPQSQHERDRIYRSMIQVSRLIDDRTMAADQWLHSWASSGGKAADPISTFAAGCDRKNIICLRHSADEKASFTLQSLAESAQLPYPEAILLITDSEGNVVAGHDTDGKWLQFQSLAALIDTGTPAVPGKAETPPDQATLLLRSAQRMGRGEQNSVFEGYPARLSRYIGGQSYAVFVASHQIGKSLGTGTNSDPGLFATVMTNQELAGRADAGTGGAADKPGSTDQLFFAYVIPEHVIDRAALRVPSQWTVNLLILLIGALLAIPFLKLFNQSPLKPIRVTDLAAILIATMLIVTTATLFVSAMLLRNSIAQDIRKELSVISARVARNVSSDLAREADLARPVARAKVPASDELAHLQSAFRMDASGTCAGSKHADCGEGVWLTGKPDAGDIDVRDRAYFRAWTAGLTIGAGNYVQFVRSKSEGKLSWSRIEGLPRASLDGTEVTPPIRVISAMPLGLRAPVLPRNFAFMIVLNTDLPPPLWSSGAMRLGDVQYHSDQALSLIENLLEEAWDNPRLAAALRVVRSDPAAAPAAESPLIPINYHARSHFAFVRPIEGTPWSVVAIYDRTEAQGLFAQTVAQTFFLCCFWVLICIATCWITPRALRLTLPPRSGEPSPAGAPPHGVPLRGRSLWFFPNRLFAETPDGFSYAFERGADGVILLLVTLGVQAASLVMLRPDAAVAVICAISLVALVGHYLLIARPRGEGRPGAPRRIGLFATVVLFGVAGYYIVTRDLGNWWIALGAIALIAMFVCLTYLLDRREIVEAGDRQAIRAVRRAFLNRAMALLLALVAVPALAFLTLVYTANLRGYVAVSLVTVSERMEEQRRALHADLAQRFSSPLPAAETLDRFDQHHPGWFVSGPGDRLSGIFSVEVSADPRTAGDPGQPESANFLASFTDALTPHYAAANSEVRESAELLAETPDAKHRFMLAQPQLFQPIHSGAASEAGGRTLIAGPIEPFPIHPDWKGWLSAVAFIAVFAWFYFRLIRKAAAHLTGLYLRRAEALPEAKERLDALIEQDPAEAWAALAEDERARLLALAWARTINFRDRAVVDDLVKKGYLAMTPYVRIANEKLAEYIRYDLPGPERDAILRLASNDRDQWDRMRLPVFVVLIAGCVLFAYASPSAVQLIMSAFLAVTALLPLTRDPIRFFEAPRK